MEELSAASTVACACSSVDSSLVAKEPAYQYPVVPRTVPLPALASYIACLQPEYVSCQILSCPALHTDKTLDTRACIVLLASQGLDSRPLSPVLLQSLCATVR